MWEISSKIRGTGLAFITAFAIIQGILLILTGILYLFLSTYICFIGFGAVLFIISGVGSFIVARGLLKNENWAWDYALGVFLIAAFLHFLAALSGSRFSIINFLISVGLMIYFTIMKSDNTAAK